MSWVGGGSEVVYIRNTSLCGNGSAWEVQHGRGMAGSMLTSRPGKRCCFGCYNGWLGYEGLSVWLFRTLHFLDTSALERWRWFFCFACTL